jgi:hypothetical protein
MKIHGTSKGAALSHKDYGVGFGGGGGGPSTRIAINSENFTLTGTETGWTIDDTNEKATATWYRNTEVLAIWCDLVDILGESIDTVWNLRYHQKLTGNFTATTGVGCYLMTGLYNQDGTFPSHNTGGNLSGHSFNCQAYTGGQDPEVLYPFINNCVAYECNAYQVVPTVAAPTWSSNGAEFYIEVIRDGNSMTMNMYSDSDYSTLISNGTTTLTGTMTTATITHLILFKNYNYSVSSFNGSGSFEIDSLYFNNGSTDAGAPF